MGVPARHALALATGLALRLVPIGVLASAPGFAQAQTAAQLSDVARLAQVVEAYASAGRLSEAGEAGRRLVKLADSTLPPMHPRLATSLWSVGLVYVDLNQAAVAEPLLRRALAIVEHMTAPPAASLASLLGSLGQLCAREDRIDEAERLYARATALLTPPAEADRPELASLQHQQGLMYLLADQPARAEPLLRQALAAREALAGPEGSAQVSQTLRMLGIARRNLKDTAGAVDYIERSIAVGQRQKPPASDELVAMASTELAVTWVEAGQPAKGEAAQRRALQFFEKSTSSSNAALARALFTLAKIESAAGNLDAAEAAASRALELRQRLLHRNDPLLADTLDVLAGIEERRGRTERVGTLRAQSQKIRDMVKNLHDDPLATSPSYSVAPQVDYPETARSEGHEGKVVLRVWVGTEGNAAFVTVVESSGYASLDEAATKAVLGMKFAAARSRGGRPMAAAVQIPVDFRR